MILQSITIPIVLFVVVNFHPHEDDMLSVVARRFCYVLIYITVIVTIWSGLPYMVRLRRIVGARDAQASS
jgi:hypothetical protein